MLSQQILASRDYLSREIGRTASPRTEKLDLRGLGPVKTLDLKGAERSDNFDSHNFQIEGLESQKHGLGLLQNAL